MLLKFPMVNWGVGGGRITLCVCVCGIAMRHSGMNYTTPDTPVWRRVVNYVAKVPIGPLIAIVQHT